MLFKLLIIFALTLLICFLLSMIEWTIKERSGFRQQAVESIANDSVREQTITGPVLTIRYTDDFEELVAVDGDKEGKKELVARSVSRYHLVFPNELAIAGDIKTDRRYRGIHQVLVYSGEHKFSGDFILPVLADLPRANAKSRITLGKATVSLGIEDVRGIRNIPKIDWNGKVIEFEQGAVLRAMSSGLHAKVDTMPLLAPERIRFAFNLGLDGIERQHFVPIAKNNTVTLKSTWPHPQFGGLFLPSPSQRVVTDAGFQATWNISSLSTGAQQQFTDRQAGVEARPGIPASVDRFGVGFIEPVNVYSLADRATKYGLLFVALTFAAFFVFEILKRLPIHPIQYLLVGLALAVFFLLLVSLSEHIEFMRAYVVAGIACTGLIGFYLANVLHDWRRGAGFGAALSLLYGALYGLLISENNALVLGSLLLFAVLAAVMVATRKVDWYQVGKSEEEAPGPQAAVAG
jgi:inner membrane protein